MLNLPFFRIETATYHRNATLQTPRLQSLLAILLSKIVYAVKTRNFVVEFAMLIENLSITLRRNPFCFRR